MNTKNLKPFDLEAALAGEPVMLRNGQKAFVRHYETEHPISTSSQIWGIDGGSLSLLTWAQNGQYLISDVSDYDIIGMWPKTRIINGFEVPAPETGEIECDDYYLASICYTKFYKCYPWHNDEYDKLWLKRGLVFLTKEDAIANAKAMLGIDPRGESGE